MSRLADLACLAALALALAAPLAACGSPVKPPATTEPAAPPAPERRATVRIDPAPGAKRFQGVWLELDGGARWVIAYRPHEVWRSFADRAVLVSGRCYEPMGQAIFGQHFEVHQIRFADPEPPDVPLLEVGPELRLRGTFVQDVYPPGTKLAGETTLAFVADDGTRYQLFGAAGDGLKLDVRVAIDARPVKKNLAYTASTGGPHLWISGVLDADAGPPDKGHVYGDCPAPGPAES